MAVTSRFWSNALIMGCTVVVAYAALLLGAIHVHKHWQRHHDGGHRPPHGPCALEHFAWLAIATGASGLLASCTRRRGWFHVFPLLMLVTELFVLVHISRGALHAVHRCTVGAERVDEVVTLTRTDIAPGVSLVSERVAVSEPYIDLRARAHCVEGVRHAVVLGCLIVAVVCTALVCCSARLAAAIDQEASTGGVVTGFAVIETNDTDGENDEGQPLTKADPLAPEGSANGQVILITRPISV